MGTRALCAVLFSLMATVGSAQDGLRSASLPERTPMAPIPPERQDLFKANSDAYSLQRHRAWLFPRYVPNMAWPNTDAWSAPPPPRPTEPIRDVTRAQPPADAARRATELPASAPGEPKTFYVIPGCYAGDRQPRIDSLPRGCDISRMRVLPPGVS